MALDIHQGLVLESDVHLMDQGKMASIYTPGMDIPGDEIIQIKRDRFYPPPSQPLAGKDMVSALPKREAGAALMDSQSKSLCDNSKTPGVRRPPGV
jgi:hypothetical protein